jgi:hypothetical protein
MQETRRTHTEMRELADKARDEVRRLQAQLDEVSSRLGMYDRAAMALEAVHPELADTPRDPAPGEIDASHFKTATGSTKGAVLDWLGRNPGQWFLIDAINRNLVDAGLLQGTPEANENRVRVATVRLAKDGHLETKKGHGRAHFYRIKSEGTA